MQMLAVNFHYIRNEKPSGGIYPRSIDEFEYQITELSRHYEFLSLSELQKMNLYNGQSVGKYCVITFYDNMKEQMNIFGYLEDNSIPAIFFSTTMPYLDNCVHDVHKIHFIFTKYSDEKLAIYLDKKYGFYDFQFSQKQIKNSYSYDNELKKKIKLFLNFQLTVEQKKDFIDNFFHKSFPNSNEFIDRFYLSKDQLKILADRDMLGTHTHSHFPLASLSNKKIKSEIKISIDYLEDLTNKKITAISYPYGRYGAVNRNVALISKSLGLKIGFTMNRGLNYSDDLKNPLMLKRVDTNDAPGGKLQSLKYIPV